MGDGLKYSVILPVYHGGNFLRQALTSLHEIDYPPTLFEVLVAGKDNDAVSRNMVEAVSATAKFKLKYIGSANDNRSEILNRACSVSRGDILVFADDDCIFFPQWLKKLSDAFDREVKIGILGGGDELELNGSLFDLSLDYVLNSFIGTGGLRSGSGHSVGKYYPKLWNMAIPRKVAFDVAVKSAGGYPQIFDESLSVHEDVDLAKRVEQSGKSIIYDPEVRIKHHRDTTLLSFFQRNFDMARTSRTLGIHRFPHFLLTIFILTMCALILSSAFFPQFLIPFVIFTGVYIAFLLVSAFGGFRRTGKLSILAIIPLLHFSLHVARGLGYLFPLKRKNRMEKVR